MVKYLNNRGAKSRSSRQQQQQDGQPPDQQQGQQGGTQAQGGPGGNQAAQAQDAPASNFLSNIWTLGKRVLTYQPNEVDDSFSLGGRRTQANAGKQRPGQEQNWLGQNQAGQNQEGQNQEGQNQNDQDQGGQNAASQAGPSQSSGQGNSDDLNRQQAGNAQQNSNRYRVSGQGRGESGQTNQQKLRGASPKGGGEGSGQNASSGAAGQDQMQDQQAGAQSQNGGKPQQSQLGVNSQAGGGQVPPPPQTAPFFQQRPPDLYGQQQVKHTQQGGTPPGKEPVPLEEQIHFDLSKNLEHVKRIIHFPDNKGFTIRQFKVGLKPPHAAFILFTEGLADKMVIDNFILEPLMVMGDLLGHTPDCDPIALVNERLVATNQVEEQRSFRKVMDSVLMGSTAIFVDGSNSALLVETKGWEHRPIGRPLVENVVRGPQEGFNEVLISNIALVRSRLRTENLVSEMHKVGRLSKADVSVMYLRDVANPAVVQEVRKRIQSLDLDYVPDTGMLEQLIEDNSLAPMPQTLSTERPDRVAAYLSEGHVAILMSSTPFALIVPVTFWALLHSAEDFYVRWPYGGLMRVVRVAAVLIGMFLPGLYIAIVNYHHSMVPQDLLFAIAASRELVPFPAVIEIIIMELSFELIREAGIRIPSIIGPTIGIVGALILGQAAVQANLITPLVIIIVALTGLSSFAIPNYNLSFEVRIIRFIYIALAAVGGFVAMSAFMLVHMAILSSTKSFGVPILSPAAPNRPSKDTVLRGTLWTQETRPNMLRPLEGRRQPPVSRPWNPASRPKRGE